MISDINGVPMCEWKFEIPRNLEVTLLSELKEWKPESNFKVMGVIVMVADESNPGQFYSIPYGRSARDVPPDDFKITHLDRHG